MPRAERVREKQERRAQLERELGAKIMALPEERFGVMLADPEWRFEVWGGPSGSLVSPDNHFPTSELEKIKARDVPSISARDCVLFLWATVPMEDQAHEVLRAWGFAYRSGYVWVKTKADGSRRAQRHGQGYWNINHHEILLVGTRGKPPAPAPGTQFSSVIYAPAREYGRKPDIVYEMIETMFPHLPRIELNARRRRKGWKGWGTMEGEP